LDVEPSLQSFLEPPEPAYFSGFVLACLGNPDPVGMKVHAPKGEETVGDIDTTEEAQAGADRREAA
jgi:hypothetical protein